MAPQGAESVVYACLVEQVTVSKLLGTDVSVTFSAAAHIEHMLSVANQRMYLHVYLHSLIFIHHKR